MTLEGWINLLEVICLKNVAKHGNARHVFQRDLGRPRCRDAGGGVCRSVARSKVCGCSWGKRSITRSRELVRVHVLGRTLRAAKLITKPRSTRLSLDRTGHELVRIGARRWHTIESLGRARRLNRVIGMAIFLLLSNGRLSVSQIHAPHLCSESSVGSRLGKATLEVLALGHPIASSYARRPSHMRRRWLLALILLLLLHVIGSRSSRSSISRSLLLKGWLSRSIISIRVVGVGT